MALEPVSFAVLGSVRVRRAGVELTPGRPQEQALLALLLARAGRPAAVGEIVDVLWGRRPPDSAVNVIRRHVGSLRRWLEPGLPTRAVGRWLVREAGGYRLLVADDSLDLLRFRRLRDEARRTSADRGAAPARAVDLLTEALELWRGPVGAGLPADVRERAGFGQLDRERLAAVREAADGALHAGIPGAVLPALQEAALGAPLDEPLLARLILTLAATDRTAEALTTYQAARKRLADELGIDPGRELREAHRTVLRGAGPGNAQARPGDAPCSATGPAAAEASAPAPAPDSVPAPTPAPTPAPGTAPAPAPIPAQLPHDLPTFTGRRAELEEVLALLETATTVPCSAPGTVVISAIGGMAGIGKTTLAVHWAHRVADRFPDGQLYVNLRGFTPSGAVMGADEAVRVFLDALGVPPERVPHGVDARAALYRSLLAGRRFLVLLDNARDTEQVRPLLPGAPGCLAIVTSRNQLTGLVAAHGAHALTLRPLDTEQARAFLERRLGAARLTGESRAVAEIAALCAGLPLALACVAARAAAHPRFALSAIAAELREAHGSLDAFSRSDTSANVGAVFSWSLSAVSADAARLFRLLALHPGPHFSAPATAALAGLPVRRARSLLTELADVHLVHEHAPGRYALHDLLRAHATELLREAGPEPDGETSAGGDAAPERDTTGRRDTSVGSDITTGHDMATGDQVTAGHDLYAQHDRAVGPVTAAEHDSAVGRLYAYHLNAAHAGQRMLAPQEDPLAPGPVPAGVRVESFADHEQALAWLTTEYPVLLAVIEAAVRSGRDRLACLLAWALEPYFDRRGHWHDWAATQRTALDAALRLGDPAWEARGLRALARAEGRLGLHEAARPRLDRALELFTELGDDIGRADTHRSLGWTCNQAGDLPGALRHNRLALELFRDSGRPAAHASVLNSVGWYHALLGEYREALSHCFQALPLLQDLGDRYGQAATWHSIAFAHHHLGRHRQALLGYGNALGFYQQLGVPYLEASTLVHIGDTHRAMSNHDDAHTAWQQALTILITLGHPDADDVRALLTAGDRCV
ncbi:AfsR/SARP family transcriptional regulator [Streptomyces neyagawaensis]|uniref:AfsR/SARP family transcriptional regulator n=3 Tax=Streptomyces neyagawaensis TaxID=42238 RepID=UPI00201D24EB|nr:BTAD domain-containing putative transcriptional regulator [Streptomyces neyagawaensis]MCL6731195.1 tetratricopeptide repeat protein [Streptomyces neyagawaensis]MDE1683682.1 BTAD domain-containing putative transcriptional regulator [Streptomyces neyagawaensis]